MRDKIGWSRLLSRTRPSTGQAICLKRTAACKSDLRLMIIADSRMLCTGVLLDLGLLVISSDGFLCEVQNVDDGMTHGLVSGANQACVEPGAKLALSLTLNALTHRGL